MHKIDIPYIVYQETKTGLYVHETRRYEREINPSELEAHAGKIIML